MKKKSQAVVRRHIAGRSMYLLQAEIEKELANDATDFFESIAAIAPHQHSTVNSGTAI